MGEIYNSRNCGCLLDVALAEARLNGSTTVEIVGVS